MVTTEPKWINKEHSKWRRACLFVLGMRFNHIFVLGTMKEYISNIYDYTTIVNLFVFILSNLSSHTHKEIQMAYGGIARREYSTPNKFNGQ